jgi:hypothetical protein
MADDYDPFNLKKHPGYYAELVQERDPTQDVAASYVKNHQYDGGILGQLERNPHGLGDSPLPFDPTGAEVRSTSEGGSAFAERPKDPLTPAYEGASPALGAFGMGQGIGHVATEALEGDYKEAGMNMLPLLAGMVVPGAPKGVRGPKVLPREIDSRGFYSPSLEAAKALPQETGTVQQMRSMLLKHGAKPKEFEATGFNDRFLGRGLAAQERALNQRSDALSAELSNTKRPPTPERAAAIRAEMQALNAQRSGINAQIDQLPPVSRAEIEQYLRDNRVQLGETVPTNTWAVTDGKDNVLARYATEDEAMWHAETKDRDGALGLDVRRVPRDQSFESYSTPGGIPGSYREVVTTLPFDQKVPLKLEKLEPFGPDGSGDAMWQGRYLVRGVTEAPFEIGNQKIGRITYWPETYNFRGERGPEKYVVNSPNMQNAGFATLDEAKAAIRKNYNEANPNNFMNKEREDIYTSSHWPGITNPLLHYRQKDFLNHADPTSVGSLEKVTQPGAAGEAFWSKMKDVDAALSGEHGRAIDDWVGGPHNMEDSGQVGGLMMPGRLESLPPTEWERMAQPVRAQLRQTYGETIPVYRAENLGGQSTGRQNKLNSYTTDRRVAESMAGVRPEQPIIGAAEIAQAEQALKRTGEATLGGTTFRYNPQDKSIDMYTGNQYVTDTPSIRHTIDDLNAYRAEINAASAAARAKVRETRLPVDAVVWATDRFNQKELIARADMERSPSPQSGSGEGTTSGGAGRSPESNLPSKTRVLDEMQSDWAQRARDQGTRDEAAMADIDRQLAETGKTLDALNDQAFPIIRDKFGFQGGDNLSASYYLKGALSRGTIESTPELKAWLTKFEETENAKMDLSNKLHAARSGVPSAPYISNTSDWVDLGLKQALIDAAKDPSVNRLAWAPGKVQADRYGLEKHVKSIGSNPVEGYGPGGKQVVLHGPSGVVASGYIDANGVIQKGYDAFREGTGRHLSEFIGKEMADKVMAKPEAHVLEGQDLRMGGEGMKSFYGDMTPEGYQSGIVGTRLQKLVKGLDPEAARVEPTKIEIDNSKASSNEYDEIFTSEQYPSVKITPAMREKILKEGLPLFNIAALSALVQRILGQGQPDTEDEDGGGF